jgi:hypothetical protein
MKNNTAGQTLIVVLLALVLVLAIALGDPGMFGDRIESAVITTTPTESLSPGTYQLPLSTPDFPPECVPPAGSQLQPYDKTSIDMLDTSTGQKQTLWAFILRDGQGAFKLPNGSVLIIDPGHNLTIHAGGQYLVLFIGCDKFLYVGEYETLPPGFVPEQQG